MLRTEFLKTRPLLSRPAYYGVVSALWLYTFAWIAAFVALIRYSQQIHWLVLGAFALILLLGTPSLRDLVKSYGAYRESWDEFNQSLEPETKKSPPAPTDED